MTLPGSGAVPPRPDRLDPWPHVRPQTPPGTRPELVPDTWPVATWELRELIPVFLMPFGLSLYVATVLGGVLRLQGEGALFVATLLQQVSFLAPVAWAHRPGRPALAAFGWRRPAAGDLARGVGIGVAGLFASGAVAIAVLEFARAVLGYTPEVTSALDPFHGEWEVLSAIVAVAVAPVCEEVLFRGFLFGGLRRRWSFWPAASISALAFAVVHGDPIRLLSLFVVGLMLAAILERTHRLAASIAAHLTLNLVSVLFLFAGR